MFFREKARIQSKIPISLRILYWFLIGWNLYPEKKRKEDSGSILSRLKPSIKTEGSIIIVTCRFKSEKIEAKTVIKEKLNVLTLEEDTRRFAEKCDSLISQGWTLQPQQTGE